MKSDSITFPAFAESGATGCSGAGSYRKFCRDNGYEHIEVVDWTSSAGDWTFIVSKDGNSWRLLSQTNNYPKPGFSHHLSDEELIDGTADEVLEDLSNRE